MFNWMNMSTSIIYLMFLLMNFYSLFMLVTSIISSPVGSLCHTRGVVRRPSSVVRRPSYVVCRLCPP